MILIIFHPNSQMSEMTVSDLPPKIHKLSPSPAAHWSVTLLLLFVVLEFLVATIFCEYGLM